MKYFRIWAGGGQEEVREERIREKIRVAVVRDTKEKRLLKWFGHLCRTTDVWDLRTYFEHSQKKALDEARSLWIEHISRLAYNKGTP